LKKEIRFCCVVVRGYVVSGYAVLALCRRRARAAIVWVVLRREWWRPWVVVLVMWCKDCDDSVVVILCA